MVGVNDVVITGLGCVSPIGIGREDFSNALFAETCGIRQYCRLGNAEETTLYAAPLDGFDGKRYVTPRKALKVMSPEVQMAYSAAHLAWQDAGLTEVELEPDRLGVIYGTEMIPGDHNDLLGATLASCENGEMHADRWGKNFTRETFPLWMLKNLPNMPACHVGIAIDARGPNNSIAMEETSSLLALIEAAMIIQRDQADLMVVGGIGSRVTPTRTMYRASGLYDQHPYDPATADEPRCVPFDQSRRGIVPGTGAGTLVVERRSHAVKRGAKILASVCGFASRCGKPSMRYGGSRVSIASAAQQALDYSGINSSELNHICAQGYSQPHLDVVEAEAIHKVAGDTVVSAHSSYFGTTGAACGILEMISSLIGMESGKTLKVLGHRKTGNDCPVNVCVETMPATQSHFLKLSFTPMGQAAAVVVECER